MPPFIRQHGAALIIMLLILVLGMTTLLVSSLHSAALPIERSKISDQALAQAKAALIGYAITYGDNHGGEVHGYLPCPDFDGGNPEGSAEAVCGSKNVSALGRFPWRTLNLPLLRDGSGECLWYAVAGSYKNNPKTDLMNWDNDGLFEVLGSSGERLAGADAASRAVAVIFAPGAAQGNQDRMPTGSAPLCGGNYIASHYLDSDGAHDNSVVSTLANAITTFVSGTSATVNDRVAYITRDDIFNALLRRSDFISTLTAMTQRTADCIAAFGTKNGYNGSLNKSLPWPAPLTLSSYGADASYDDTNDLYAGRVPYQADTAKTATGNSISGINLLNASNCPGGWSAVDAWWNNWKDHLFYAIAAEFKPGSLPTGPCGTCLRVNGSGQYAAVILFAARKLPAQERTDRSVLSAYLEGRNASNYPNAGGNGDYEVSAGADTFNDVLYCIDENLAVLPCPP
ncbi:MAG: hypothetical protein ACLQHK_04415 [Gallionellaceae bacterium]